MHRHLAPPAAASSPRIIALAQRRWTLRHRRAARIGASAPRGAVTGQLKRPSHCERDRRARPPVRARQPRRRASSASVLLLLISARLRAHTCLFRPATPRHRVGDLGGRHSPSTEERISVGGRSDGQVQGQGHRLYAVAAGTNRQRRCARIRLREPDVRRFARRPRPAGPSRPRAARRCPGSRASGRCDRSTFRCRQRRRFGPLAGSRHRRGSCRRPGAGRPPASGRAGNSNHRVGPVISRAFEALDRRIVCRPSAADDARAPRRHRARVQ